MFLGSYMPQRCIKIHTRNKPHDGYLGKSNLLNVKLSLYECHRLRIARRPAWVCRTRKTDYRAIFRICNPFLPVSLHSVEENSTEFGVLRLETLLSCKMFRFSILVSEQKSRCIRNRTSGAGGSVSLRE